MQRDDGSNIGGFLCFFKFISTIYIVYNEDLTQTELLAVVWGRVSVVYAPILASAN